MIINNNRSILTTGMSSLQECPHYRCVLTIGVSTLQMCPRYRGVLTTEVSSLQRCPCSTTGVSSLQRCPHYRCTHYRDVLITGVLATEVSSPQGCTRYKGVLTTGVSLLQRHLHYIGFLIIEVSPLPMYMCPLPSLKFSYFQVAQPLFTCHCM